MKKKDNLANDAAMFFLVAVISVSLSVFVSEVNTITRDSAAQAVGATSSTTYTVAEIQNQITALQAQIAALENTPQGATMMPALQAMLATLQAQLATLSTTPTVTTITDYSLLKNCFLKQKTAGGLCSITDLNSDGVTNFADIALAKATSGSATSTSPSTYDLNGDGKVNFIETVVTTTSSGSGTLSDLTLFKSCFFKTSPLTGICALSDFNGDGAINFGDLALWKANNGSTSSPTIAKYDLNSDGKISYIYDADIEPATTTLTDYNLLRYCFFSKPLGICSIADFNNDRAINFGDLSLAKANLNATDLASIEKYDLTGDGKVNYFSTALLATSTVNDLDLLKSCFFKGPSLTGVCSIADFNNDGYVNFGDLTLFKQNLSSRDPLVIQKYDLNGDGRIWWLTSESPGFSPKIDVQTSYSPDKSSAFVTIKIAPNPENTKAFRWGLTTECSPGVSVMSEKEGAFLTSYCGNQIQKNTSEVFNINDGYYWIGATAENKSSSPGQVTFHLVAFGQATCDKCDLGSDKQTIYLNPKTSTDSYPTISLSAQPTNISLGAPVLLTATVNDDKGVAGVQFYVGVDPYGPEKTVAPYTTSFSSNKPGNYSIYAIARDTDGQKRGSNNVMVSVSSAVVSSLAPSSGPVGTKVQINGSGFSNSNNIVFVGSTVPVSASNPSAVSPIDGSVSFNNVISLDGKTLTFVIPSQMTPQTGENGITTKPAVVVPGTYYVVVVTDNGKSQPVYFQVTSPTSGGK